MMFRILILFSFLVLGACQENLQELPKTGLASFEEPQENSIKVQAQGVVGQGRLLFNDRLLGINSREHYRIEGRFLGAEGEVALHSHFNGFMVHDGLVLRFQRHDNHLHVLASAPGYPEREIKEIADFFSPSRSTFSFRVEVADGGVDGIEITIWNERRILKTAKWEKLDTFTRKTAIFDSVRDGIFFFSNGEGARWGIEINRAELTTARRSSPLLGGVK